MPQNEMPEMKYDHIGAHLRAYDYYGAHRIEDECIFRVWAPHADEVYIEGDFNIWKEQDPSFRMNKINDYGDFELKVPLKKEYSEYRYRIYTKNGVYEKVDPFAFRLKERKKYCSEIYDLDNYVWHDQNWIDYRKKVNPITSPINIYEIHLGSWEKAEDGSFINYRDIAEDLVRYVKDMGYTHIELMPVMETSNYDSMGYETSGYYAPSSRYGSPDDIMFLIDYCHTHGIGVIIDWMVAGIPKDSHGLYKFDGEYCYEYGDDQKRTRSDNKTCNFDFNKSEVRTFLMSNAFFWIEKYHIDGIRVNSVSSMIYLDYEKKNGEWTENEYGGRENIEAIHFLSDLNIAIKVGHPDVFTAAAENSAWPMVTRSSEIGGLGFTFKWNMGWAADTMEYAKVDPIFRKNYHKDVTFPFTYAFCENYILPIGHSETVHDKMSLFEKIPGDYRNKIANIRTFLGYMIASPGKKLLFMGNEFGQLSEWDIDRQLDWSLLDNHEHRALKNYVKELNLFYLDHPALWQRDNKNDSFRWISSEDSDQNIIAFMRCGSEEKLIFLVNFAPVTRYDYKIGVPFKCEYEEIFSSDAVHFAGTGVKNGKRETYPFKLHGFNQQICLTVPPMSMICLKAKC